MRDLTYWVGDFGWGPKSEELPGRVAAFARGLHVVMWWVFVWPSRWGFYARRFFGRWTE